MLPERVVKPKSAALRAAFKADLEKCWNRARALHQQDRPYAFVLYGVEGRAAFSAHVLTEEGLTQVAQRYVTDGFNETLDEARDALRYSVPDSPYFDELENGLSSTEVLLKPCEKFLVDEETAAYKVLAIAAMAALKELDVQGLFGNPLEREKLLLVIITEDTEEDWTMSSVRKLNPPAVVREFQNRSKGDFVCIEVVALAPDGQSLYAIGDRSIAVKKKTERVSEIAAYDVVGNRLKRRWKFLFPPGDGGREVGIVCSHDGKTVVAVRYKIIRSIPETRIMRFGVDRNAVLAQTDLEALVRFFAISCDESRIAAGLIGNIVHILDHDFSLLRAVNFPAMLFDLKFLASGDLLVATDEGIFRIDKDFALSPTPFRETCSGLSFDRTETLMAAALDWRGGARRQAEIGCKLVRLPSLETVREIVAAELSVEQVAMSPNGRYIAMRGKKIGTYFQFVAVCDTETGREIARRRADTANTARTINFLNDNRTLVIAGSEVTKTEPIEFWPVPDI